MVNFKKGDRVIISEEGFKVFKPHTYKQVLRTRGRVVGFGGGGTLLRILRDSTVTPELFHPSFWQLDEDINRC